VSVNAHPANLDLVGHTMGGGRCHDLMRCRADRTPPGVGILFARVWSTTRRSSCNCDWRTRLSVEQERFDRTAPEVEGEQRGADWPTHQMRRG
jgi:hypothetical protein